jgi:type II secretory pathway component PulK
MALIMVLLLMAVVSSLVAGLTMNGQVEVAMAHNETYYAGARAAAEAGMNRAIAAIVADTTTTCSPSGLIDPVNPASPDNDDNVRHRVAARGRRRRIRSASMTSTCTRSRSSTTTTRAFTRRP